MDFQSYWNNSFEKYQVDKNQYSEWLDKYIDIIKKSKTPVLDLGCGSGSDSYYLVDKGLDVIACDFSQVALDKLELDVKEAKTILLDITKPLPFKDNSFNLVLADLSLHYFDENTTKNIIQEIERILTPNGYLLARVNSLNDYIHGAGQGEKLENNYYFVKGYNKRFFDENEVNKFFSIIGQVEAKETKMLRDGKLKPVIEIKAKKSKM